MDDSGGLDHVITWEEFKEYYTNISISFDRDDTFEYMVN